MVCAEGWRAHLAKVDLKAVQGFDGSEGWDILDVGALVNEGKCLQSRAKLSEHARDGSLGLSLHLAANLLEQSVGRVALVQVQGRPVDDYTRAPGHLAVSRALNADLCGGQLARVALLEEESQHVHIVSAHVDVQRVELGVTSGKESSECKLFPLRHAVPAWQAVTQVAFAEAAPSLQGGESLAHAEVAAHAGRVELARDVDQLVVGERQDERCSGLSCRLLGCGRLGSLLSPVPRSPLDAATTLDRNHRPAAGASARAYMRAFAIVLPLLAATALEDYGHPRGRRVPRERGVSQHTACCRCANSGHLGVEMADAEIAALKEQVAKEKATSRENLKKVMKITQEKKALEEQLAAAGGGGGGNSAEMEALRAQVAALQQQMQAKAAEVSNLQEELESAKEEAQIWQDEAEASAAQAKLNTQSTPGSAAGGGAATVELERKLAEAIAARDAEMSARQELLQANTALQATVAKLEKEKGA